jgi:hypothetical protein
MFVRSQSPQVTPALAARILAGLVAAVPPRVFDVDSKVALYIAGPAMAFVDHAVGDFTKPVFQGYADIVMATSVGPINVPGAEVKLKSTAFIAATGGAIPGEAILGYFIFDTDGVTVLMWEQFAAPIPIAAVGDSVLLDVLLGPKTRWAGENG